MGCLAKLSLLVTLSIFINVDAASKVKIGFQETLYFITESSEQVAVNVAVLNGSLSEDVNLTLNTMPDSAKAPEDYDSTTELVTFSSSNTQHSVLIPIANDDFNEALEQFFVGLTFDDGDNRDIEVQPPAAVIMIIDDDTVQIGFVSAEYSVSESFPGSVTLSAAVLSGELSRDILVRLTTRQRTARAPEDFELVSRLLAFSIDVRKVDVEIPIIDDDRIEPREEFTANLTLVTDDLEVDITPAQTTVTIIDDDEEPAPEVAFEFSVYTVPENDLTMPLCVDVSIAVTEATAYTITAMQSEFQRAEYEDFVNSTSITVNLGSSRACIDFTEVIVDDNIALEGRETFIILVGNSMAMVTIIDDDAPALRVPDVMVNEADERAEICIEIDNEFEITIKISFITIEISNGATEDKDFVRGDGALLLMPGESQLCLKLVEIIDDNIIEADETFSIEFSFIVSSSFPAIPSIISSVTIIDNDMVIGFNPISYTVREGIETVVRLDLFRAGNIDLRATANITTVSVTARSGLDFISVDQVVVFPSGESGIFFTISILDDSALESVEEFTVIISSNQPNIVIPVESGTAVVTIFDTDRVSVSFMPNSYMVTEGNERELRVVLSGDYDIPVEVLLSTTGISATGNIDYIERTNVSIIFLPGNPVRSVTLTTLSDEVIEGEETLIARLRDGPDNVDISRIEVDVTDAIVTITEDTVPELSFSTDGVRVSEGSVMAQVCLSLSVPLSAVLTVSLTLSNTGTATQDVDFGLVESVVVFQQNAMESCVQLVILEDSLALEGDETIVASFITPPGIQQGSRIFFTVTIIDNDEFVINFAEKVYIYEESDQNTEVCLVGDGEIAQQVTATVSSFILATATGGEDYLPIDGIVVFSVLASEEVCFPVIIINDVIAEGDEFFSLVIVSVSQGSIIGDVNTTNVVITDDDDVTLGFELTEYSVVEGEVVEICLVLQGSVDSAFSVFIETSDMSALADVDYENTTMSIVFEAGVQLRCFDIATTPDGVSELLVERFRVSITSTTAFGVIIITQPSTVVSIVDNDAVVISLEQASYTTSENKSIEVCAVLRSGAADFTVTARLQGMDGTARVFEDYGSLSAAFFTFQPLITRNCITINIIDDIIDEDNEIFLVFLSIPSSTVTVSIGRPNQATVIIIDNDDAPPTKVVCELSSPMRVTPFATSLMYAFSDICDHWLVAPSVAANGVIFSVAAHFFEDLRIGRITVLHRNLELVSTADGEVESNLSPESRESTTLGLVYTFLGNVVATVAVGVNSVELRDIGVTVTHTYAPQSSESIQIEFSDAARLPRAQGLCGNINGQLVFGGNSNEVADIMSIVQLQRFSRSWILPASLQTSTVEECLTLQMNDTVIADPQFSVSTTGNASEALCYEVHGSLGQYFNLISDSCTSVNAHFTSMPNPAQGNRMTTVGIHAMHAEEPIVLGLTAKDSKCVNVRIELKKCEAFIDDEPLTDEGYSGQVTYKKKYTYNGYPQWQVAVPNCEEEELMIKVTCREDMLRIDVNRKVQSDTKAHGLMGQFWNVPIAPTVSSEGKIYVDINKPSDTNYRHIPARKHSLQWDHHHKTCYYVGNSQGGPGESRSQLESVIEGTYKDYKTQGLFDTGFKYGKFNDDICGV